MKDEYNLGKLKSKPNPYASRLNKPVTIRMGENVVSYFKAMSKKTGVPYQSLINLYLQDCVSQEREINISWKSGI